MLIVTGTKRSGTSMWMQILSAGGFEVMGEAFPGIWGESIRDANSQGFYESRFRNGIFYRTNPDPKTGQFIHPSDVKRHAIKVFIPGLVRSDLAYIGPVISTMRDWREYCVSLQRLYSMEDEFRAQAKAEGRKLATPVFPDEATEARVRAGKIPPALEWWFENYDLIRDVATRRYHFYMTTYERLLADPRKEVEKVFKWLGHGDVNAALEVVKPELRTQTGADYHDPLTEEFEEVFDEFYAQVHTHQNLSAAFIEKLNETNQVLSERWSEVVTMRRRAAEEAITLEK